MLRLSLKNIWSRKGRLLLTAAAIIAGTAFLSGVFVFTDTIRDSFDRLFASAYANTDAFVRSNNVIEGDFGSKTRDRIPDTLLPVVQAVPGVGEAYGNVQSFARISTLAGKKIGRDNGAPNFGASFSGSKFSPWTIGEGRAPAGPTEVAIDAQSAKDGKIQVGDQVKVTTVVGVRQLTVVGIALFAGNSTTGGATFALFDLPTAQDFVIGQKGELDAITVHGDGTRSQTQLASDINAAIDQSNVEVLTGKQITKETQTDIERGLSFFTLFLSIFALISIFVGSFIIYNVFSISAAQRQQENALLRAIGASRRQVSRSLLLEAVVVGIGGSLIGCLGGIGLASGITALLKAAGIGLSDSTLVLRPTGFVITLLVGTVVAMLCAIVPALRAGRVPPLAAMRDVAVDRADVSRKRLITGFSFLAVAAAAIVLGLAVAAIWLGPGVVALFAALIALGPLFSGPVAKGLTPVLGKINGATGMIAGRNASRSPKRTAVTAGALGVGLSLLIGVATLGSSAKATIHAAFSKQFTGDFTISAGEQGFGGLPSNLAGELQKLPEVGAAVGLSPAPLQRVINGEGKVATVLALDANQAADLMSLPFTSGGWDGMVDNGILYSKDEASSRHATVGDTVDVVLLNGTSKTLTVRGIFDSRRFGAIIVDKSVFADSGTPLFDGAVFVKRAANVSTGAASTAIAAFMKNYPTGKFQSRAQFIASQSEKVDTFLRFIYALLGMSIFIAILGIVITLMLAIYERRRELGLSRAVGMTRGQVRTSVFWESIITAVIGMAMGLGLGLALGWIIVRALKDKGLDVFAVPTFSIVVFAVLSLVFAAIASILPARRAAKSDVLQAIATT